MVSNKSLAVLIVAAVVISLGGTIISLNRLDSLSALRQYGTGRQITGYASSSGQVNLTINSSVACNVDSNVLFGTSNKPTLTYSLTSDKDNAGLAGNTSFYNCTDAAGGTTNMTCKGLEINNTGNVHANISLNSNANASTLLGSQSGLDITDFRYYVRNGTVIDNSSNGCRNITNGTTQIEGTQLNVLQSTDQLICRNITHDDGQDTMHVEFNITLENDVAPGTKTAIVTITCEPI